ncbi:hypothetical protein Pla175_21260 [Pirellulimonas nuda]|uniref:Hydantoinase A/oxoprolinase domain-containing protein n=2 Tax=Pirellulimonas nuda TaxID=2528009 RepID=A0A518DB79_9BACT|nr:hypothetical protein Pla175_21260 [Pirellulimonas nuda]
MHIGRLLARAPKHHSVALTTTAELADCFASKSEGVRAVIDAVRAACGRSRLVVYSTDQGGSFVDGTAARSNPIPIAAANWLALANWAAGQWRPSDGLMIDLGSTTTDIIWLRNSRAAPLGTTDAQRLASGELVYTGLLRTPVAAIASKLASGGKLRRVAAEWFAHAADAHVILRSLPEGTCYETADGRPADWGHAKARLARSLCLDAGDLSDSQAELLAGEVVRWQCRAIEDGIAQVASNSLAPIRQVIVSGAGWRLAKQAVQNVLPSAAVASIAGVLGEPACRCAAAVAVAALASPIGDGA